MNLYPSLRNSLKRRIHQSRHLFGKITSSSRPAQRAPKPARALAWIKANELPTGGIRVHSESPDAYPEVSGYLIPTLLEYGEKELAKRILHWLLCIERADGSYTSSDGIPHIFDTGQVLRGLLAGAEIEPAALDSAQRAADYLLREMLEGGAGGFGPQYSGEIPETVLLYTLPPLMEAADTLDRPEYKKAAQLCMDYYCSHSDFLNPINLTHFLGYELEALIDLDHVDMATRLLDTLAEQANVDGSLRAMDGANWICAPGLAQLAICWFKIGQWKPADKALEWLESRQHSTGGFLGSYGRGASYFPRVEIPWAAKFYLDAHLLRVESFFDRNVGVFPSTVSLDDGRIQAILPDVEPKNRILEVGCGKGRFLKAVHEVYPEAECTGIDISQALLSEMPEGINAIRGSLESIPLPDDGFDLVFSVEAVEHSTNLEAAISELIRVTRPGGWILVIDKHQSHWGRLDCPPWEDWPEASTLQRLLNKGCDNVSVEPVGYDGKPASDGLMLLWRGQKRSLLSGREWNETLISPSTSLKIVDRVRKNHVSEWGQAIMLATSPNEAVIEVGSGTGEISLHLAQAGRKVSILDISKESLEFVRSSAEELGVSLEIVEADATKPLPFPDNAFDCVWSSGLLEHFSPAKRSSMLREQARITKGRVISLVPNAACIAYQVGKGHQEMHGIWPYGLETPILSMQREFEASGLRVTSEYSVGAKHALTFLPPNHPMKTILSAWMESVSLEELQECNQGYLLITIGYKVENETAC